MINFVIALASDWRGGRVACRFKASANGSPITATDDTAPAYQLPDGTTEVTITATPTAVAPKVPVHWEKSVTLSVPPTGPVTAKAGSTAFVTLTPPKPISSDMQYTVATIKLSRFKDATADVVDLLKHLPTIRTVNGTDQRVDAAKEVADHTKQYGAWPPANWNLNAVPDAHFLEATEPVKSGLLIFKKGSLAAIDVDSVVLKIAGTDVPQLFAVTWPRTKAPTATSGPTRFFLFIRQSNKGNQYDLDGLFVGGDLAPYPNNFDYADEGLFANLHYGHDPLREASLKGVPYQVAKAVGDKVVTVVPCNKFGEEFGVLKKTKQTGWILEEIQAFMFWRAGVPDPPKTVGKTAIAAFSSGTFHLDDWLRDADNLKDPFLNDVVSAVYWLDPRTDYVDRFIEASLNWAGSADRDKRIRLYMRYPSAAHTKLLGTTPSAPYIQNAAKDKRTAAVITDQHWAKVVSNYLKVPAFDKVNWGYAHHVICATMLTHALAWGDLS